MRTDPRIVELAERIVNYSWRLQPGEIFYVDMVGLDTSELGSAIIRAGTEAGGVPFWHSFDDRFSKPFFAVANEQQNQKFAKFHQTIMEAVDCYIGIRGPSNPFELNDLPEEQARLKEIYHWQQVHSETRCRKRWAVMRYPNFAMATLAQKSVTEFEDFFFRVCNLDYSRMSEAMTALVRRLDLAHHVRIVSPGTELEFSLSGMKSVKCDGKINIPDGEVFTAPVRDSINGVISFNTPALYHGTEFRNIRFDIDRGRVVKASSSHHRELEQILDLDEGSRYFGEFALGVNPHILHPMCDALFDEKIAGSLHLALGSSYEVCDNGNHSSVHWDLVLIQRPEYGGGELFLDGELIRKDGLFISPDLRPLNPDQLLS